MIRNCTTSRWLVANKDSSQVRSKRVPTALKRMKQNQKKKLQNRVLKSRTATAIRALKESFRGVEKDKKEEKLASVYALVDKGVKKGVYKRNKADRIKSRLTLQSNKAL